MVVSMMQFIIELPEAISIKEKRRVVRSLKDKLQKRFHLTVSEVDLHDSLAYSQIGVAIVSNSRQFGESVLQKALDFVDREGSARLQDVSIFSETY